MPCYVHNPLVSSSAYFWAYAGLAAVVVDGERFPVEGGRERSPWMQVRGVWSKECVHREVL